METSNYLRVVGVSNSVDEFNIRQTTYKISIKLEPESGPQLPFTTVYSNNPQIPAPIYCIKRSANLSSSTKGSKTNIMMCELPSHFSFYFELERDLKHQKMESCALYLKRVLSTGRGNASSSMIKYAVGVICPCANEKEKECIKEKKINHASDLFPDCNKADMIDFHQNLRLQVGKHTHNCHSYGLSQTFLITITEFDFSEATLVPYEAQKILAKRTLEKEVKDTGGAYFDEIRKPFDVTIICKDGYEIDVHGFVLSARNPVFRKMLSASTKLSGRGSSFKKLFMIKEARNKKSKTITIDESEVNSVAMEVILHFIYFGELHSNWKLELPGVLHAARKYGLKQLLDFLNVLLITMCKRKNAISLLRLAERYTLKGAETALRDYIFTNLGGVLQASVKITSV